MTHILATYAAPVLATLLAVLLAGIAGRAIDRKLRRRGW